MSTTPVRSEAISEIERKIMHAKKLQAQLDEFYAWLRSSPPLPRAADLEPSGVRVARDTDDFSKMNHQQAVLEVVKGGTGPFSKNRIMRALEAGGLTLDRKTVGNALYRLRKKGKISRQAHDQWVVTERTLALTAYAGMSQRQAVTAFLQEADKPHTPSQIAEAVTAGGLQTEANNFATSVSALLGRLERKGLATRVGKGLWISRRRIAG